MQSRGTSEQNVSNFHVFRVRHELAIDDNSDLRRGILRKRDGKSSFYWDLCLRGFVVASTPCRLFGPSCFE